MNPRLLLLLLAACCSGLAAQSVGDVLINEFCYDSDKNLGTSTGADLEWIELYNTTGSAIDLTNWQIGDNSGLVVLPSGSAIPANGYFVIALTGNAAQFLGYTGWPADYVNTQTWSGLGNSGDGIALFTPSAALCIDYVQYASGAAVPNAPTWTGTRPPDVSGPNDFAYARIPNGVNGDTVAGDAGSEAAATSFDAAPFTPGRANGGTVVDVFVPDEFSAHYTAGATAGSPFPTLAPRDGSDPLRMKLNLPPGYDFNTTSTFGFTNGVAFRARYHDTAASVSVTFAVNGTETNVSTANLTLPSGGSMAVSDQLLALSDTLTGQLPATPGQIVIDIVCAVASGPTTTFKLQIDVDAPEIGTSPNLADIVEAQTSQVAITATGGAAPYTWGVANNPAWISINPTTGQLTMTPPTASTGNHSFDVTVSDSNTPARTDTVNFDVDVVALLNITTSALAAIAENGSPTETIGVSGGTPNFSFSLTGAPAWLSINPTSGALGGTAPSGSANTYNFNVLVSDSGNPAQNDSQALSLTVVTTVTITSPSGIPDGIEATAYNYTFTASGGQTPYVWSATGLPGFLTINPNTGLLAGTPSNADSGTYNFTVTVTDASTAPQVDNLAVTLVIDDLSSTSSGGGGDGGGGCAAAGAGPVLPVVLLGLLLYRRRKNRS